MKKRVNLLLIGLMTLFFSFNVALSYAETSFDGSKMRPKLSQSKVKTIKNGSVFVGNMESPRQIAVYGTPAWLFKTVSICFFDGKMCGMTCSVSAYSIDMYTGGLGRVLYSDTSKATEGSYCVKDGRVYVWDSGVAEPKDESGYSLVFSIEEECLTLIKTQIEAINAKKFVYMADYSKMKKMSDEQLYQIEVVAFTKLLRDKETNQKVGKQEQMPQKETEEQRRREQERLERERKEAAKRQREADSIASQHVKELKLHYSKCRFLFNSEESFVSCISRKNQADIENEMKPLLIQKLNELSTIEFFEEKEFYEFDAGKLMMLRICDICEFSDSYTKNIADYTEKELENYVAKRGKIAKAYNKEKKKDPNMKCSAFLVSYINNK